MFPQLLYGGYFYALDTFHGNHPAGGEFPEDPGDKNAFVIAEIPGEDLDVPGLIEEIYLLPGRSGQLLYDSRGLVLAGLGDMSLQ